MCRVESLFGIKTVKMTNVRIIYLPANTTTFVQPLDQGLIACFKMRFRQLRVAELIKVFDEGTSGAELRRSKPGARLTVTWIGDSVKSIDASTIQRCFWRTGCLPDQWLPQLEHVTPTTMGSPSGVSQAVIADLSDAIQRLQLGHRAMSPMEFVCFDELQPTSELMEPNLELGVDCEMLNSELSFTMQTMTADALLDRSERRVARQATEVLITYARAKGIQPHAALARARGARERVEPEGAVEEAVGVEGGVGVAGGVVAGVEVVVAAVEAEVAAEVVAEEAVGAVGATVLVGEVAVATGVAVEAGVAVEEGVGVARPSGAALGVGRGVEAPTQPVAALAA
ncbi:unnamed protein product [Closterium sp. NIES-65]|nr:unnamed protein product [Closterium sp. NIES-65]